MVNSPAGVAWLERKPDSGDAVDVSEKTGAIVDDPDFDKLAMKVVYDDPGILYETLSDAHVSHQAADTSSLEHKEMWRHTVVSE